MRPNGDQMFRLFSTISQETAEMCRNIIRQASPLTSEDWVPLFEPVSTRKSQRYLSSHICDVGSKIIKLMYMFFFSPICVPFTARLIVSVSDLCGRHRGFDSRRARINFQFPFFPFSQLLVPSA